MRIKVLSRNPEDFCRETVNDLNIIHRNFDSKLHPFQTPREYVRAVNAAKLDRIFARPFILSLSGHKEPVTRLRRHPTRVSWIASGSMDGVVKVWDLKSGKCLASCDSHECALNGLSVSSDGTHLLTSGTDCKINIFTMDELSDADIKLKETRIGDGAIYGLDCSRNSTIFATGGASLRIYDLRRIEPITKYAIDETLNYLSFNQIEENILGCTSSDRSLSLYDVRQKTKCSKIFLNMRGNAISWNPIEANMLVLASEDSNCYIFDVRNFKNPTRCFSDHANSVLDVDFSPTGLEFVSASYDRSIRIYSLDKKKSREVYHTKRMQRIHSVIYTADSHYVACGSDEMNIRLWKAEASKKLGYLRPRQKGSLNYNKKLIYKYRFHPEIMRINNHRHLPRHLFNLIGKKKTEQLATKRKIENAKLFSKTKIKQPKTVVKIED
ncbi:DDB1- and CUL4-associated factor 13 [Thelohanellus kitauei]|uniref:DDB1- and CUL4-associated factor 13 n=1 Tax=Thelohanellus kitauei TaxID=669202 RepID=A0A0C2M1J4_THEKT|nr:DDB1- and CUL4-associated factor 13 [Thelohanellus kitauei]